MLAIHCRVWPQNGSMITQVTLLRMLVMHSQVCPTDGRIFQQMILLGMLGVDPQVCQPVGSISSTNDFMGVTCNAFSHLSYRRQHVTLK